MKEKFLKFEGHVLKAVRHEKNKWVIFDNEAMIGCGIPNTEVEFSMNYAKNAIQKKEQKS